MQRMDNEKVKLRKEGGIKKSPYCLISVLVSAICIYGLFLRFHGVGNRQYTIDEQYQLMQMKGSFLDMLKLLPNYEFCPYLSGDYYLVYPFFKLFGFNHWGLSIPHIAATLLAFYFLYLICKQHFKTVWGYLITFTVVCFNATLIWHAGEIRTYAVWPMLALGVFYFSALLIENRDGISTARKLAIYVFFTLVILFHVYGIMIFLASLLYQVLTHIRSTDLRSFARDNFKFFLLVFCIVVPVWFLSVFGQHLAYRQDCRVFEFIPGPAENIVGFLKAVFGNLVGSRPLYFLLAGVFFPFIFPFKDRRNQIALLLITVFLPIGLILISDLKTKYWFIQRQFIWVMPFFALYLGWVWDSLFVFSRNRLSKSKGADCL